MPGQFVRGAPGMLVQPGTPGIAVPSQNKRLILSAGILQANQLSGLVDWHRADLGISLASSTVTAWNDSSGSGDANKNLGQVTAGKRPTFTASSTAYNGKPLVNFASGASQFLKSGTWTSALSQPSTVVIVGHDDHSVSGGGYFDDLTFTGQLLDNNGTNYQIFAGGAVPKAWLVANTPTIYVCVFNGASSALYVGARTSATGTAGNGGRTGLYLGILGDGVTAPLNGGIAEIAVYNRVLSTPEINAWLDYGRVYYGLTISA